MARSRRTDSLASSGSAVSARARGSLRPLVRRLSRAAHAEVILGMSRCVLWGTIMSQSFEAIYQTGVLRPANPVTGVAEGQRVWVMADPRGDMAAIQAGIDDMEAGRVAPF